MSAFYLRYSTESIYTYSIVISYAYMCIGSQSTLFPTFAVKIFGTKVGAKMFPMIYFFFAIANVMQWGLNFFVFSQDLDTLIWILTGFVILAFILTCFINETPDWSLSNKANSRAKDLLLQKELGKIRDEGLNNYEIGNAEKNLIDGKHNS